MKFLTTTAIASILAASAAVAETAPAAADAGTDSIILASADTTGSDAIPGRGADNPRGEDLANEETRGTIVYETIGENSVRDLGEEDAALQVNTEFDNSLSPVVEQANPMPR